MQSTRSFETWYIAYAVLGLVQNGVAPILLPLSARHGLDAGLTYSAFSLSGLAAPMLGAWSDRRQRHRVLLVGGLGLAAIALFLFPLVSALLGRLALAMVAGLGVIAASTVGNMFIVEVAPQAEWDQRIGALQSWISAGQVVGLILAGLLALSRPRAAFEAAAAALVFGALIAWLYAPTPGQPVPRGVVAPSPLVGGEAGATHRQFHRVTLRGLRTLLDLPSGALMRFLGVWLLSYTATNAVSAMLPVAMTHEYGTSALVPSVAYAIGIGLSLPFYRPVGRWEARVSAARVLLTGFAGRAVLLAVMAALGFMGDGWTVWAILAGFAGTQVLWPLLAVSGNTLSVTLDPARRGEGVGLLNAANAAGATIGGIVGGLLVQDVSYAALCAVGCVAVTVAGVILRRERA
ncbi:MAG: MFS transporter [Acetobacteraceae bacterium]